MERKDLDTRVNEQLHPLKNIGWPICQIIGGTAGLRAAWRWTMDEHFASGSPIKEGILEYLKSGDPGLLQFSVGTATAQFLGYMALMEFPLAIYYAAKGRAKYGLSRLALSWLAFFGSALYTNVPGISNLILGIAATFPPTMAAMILFGLGVGAAVGLRALVEYAGIKLYKRFYGSAQKIRAYVSEAKTRVANYLSRLKDKIFGEKGYKNPDISIPGPSGPISVYDRIGQFCNSSSNLGYTPNNTVL